MEPRYSTKTRAKRIEPEYFKRLHPFRRWRLILSITVPVVAAAWLVAYAARGDQRIYTSGPLSTGHAMFGTQCADCHGPGRAAAPGGTPTSAFFVRVSDRACLACHDAPVHHESQAFDPRCASCHVEHKGAVWLAAPASHQCSQCHADLTRMSRTPPTVAPRVRDFGSSHPEFAVAVKEQNVVRRVPLNRGAELKDLAQVKLNHQKHLKVGLKGLDELRTLKGPFRILEKAGGLQLACAFCHQPEASRASMQPISYIRHCGPGCHPLPADAEKETPSPRAPSPSALEWASAQLQGAERVMFKQKCEFCHTLSSAPDRLPRVAPTAIPARWLPHSVFDHGAHRPLACTECHKATASTDTTDVLLPSITVCRECHRQGGGARAGCVECHIYHDKAKERDPSGPFAVPQLTKGSRSTASPPR